RDEYVFRPWPAGRGVVPLSAVCGIHTASDGAGEAGPGPQTPASEDDAGAVVDGGVSGFAACGFACPAKPQAATYFFGRNAFTTASFVVRYGPSSRSMQ